MREVKQRNVIRYDDAAKKGTPAERRTECPQRHLQNMDFSLKALVTLQTIALVVQLWLLIRVLSALSELGH